MRTPVITPSQPKPGLYRHYKGDTYRVVGIAHHSETRETLVVYQALYGEYGLWVRPHAMFIETLEHEGKQVERFSYVSP